MSGERDAPIGFTPLGRVRSCFATPFGAPRQAGLAPHATAVLEVDPAWAPGLAGLEIFSHLWLIWVFHRNKGPGHTHVRPPRLGGDTRVGVFATRSPYRPNPIGLSVVRLLRIEGRALHLGGVDLADGTPVLDLKPYLPYADAVPEATAGWASAAPTTWPVRFEPEARARCDAPFAALITEVFGQDPRPAPHRRRPPGGEYGITLESRNVRARFEGDGWRVLCVD